MSEGAMLDRDTWQCARARGKLDTLLHTQVLSLLYLGVEALRGGEPVRCREEVASACLLMRDQCAALSRSSGELRECLRAVYGYCLLRLESAGPVPGSARLHECIRLLDAVSDLEEMGPQPLRRPAQRPDPCVARIL